MHSTDLLEQFRTGEKGMVRCVLLNTRDLTGKQVEFEREGDKYVAGIGDGVVRLMELIELRRQRSTFWYRFFNGRFSCLELDVSIKKLQDELNEVKIGWVE